MPQAFDLQAHSTRSDGVLEPHEVVARAAAAGIELLALTDHDTVAGVAEATRAAREHGIALVAASELSTVDDDIEDLHLLGYGLDPEHTTLRDALREYRADRNRRAEQMRSRLVEAGLTLDPAALEARREADAPIGRPHLAAAVLEAPENAERLRDEGVGDVGALIEAYLVPGAPAYTRRTRPTVTDAIALIHEAGGVAVWAHPFWDLDEPQAALSRLERFAGLGLDGVEAFYPTHSCEQTHLLCDRAAELGLLTTGSADFHGPDHKLFRAFGAFDLCGREPNLGPIAAGAATR